MGMENFRGGKWVSHCKVQGHSAVICAKMAEPIEIPFGLLAWMSPRNYEIDPDPSWEGTISRGERAPIAKYKDFLP